MFPDIFNDEAFSLTSLTAVISSVDYVPGRAGELAFSGVGEGIATTTISVEQVAETLVIIPTTTRGSPAPQAKQDKRTLRGAVPVPHIQLEDTLVADQIQNVRQLGSMSTLRGAQQVVNTQLRKLAGSHDLTLERLRLGALKGQVLDQDNSVILDLYSFFGVTAPQDVSFEDVFVATPDADDLTTVRTRAQQVTRFQKAALKGGWNSNARIWALCGDNFFDKLIESTSVKGVWDGWAAAERKLGANYAHGIYEFAGIFWENYQGTDDQHTGDNVVTTSAEGTVGINPDECQFLVTGVPGLYAEYYAPADFWDTVNTLGLPRYARQAVDPEFGRWVKLHTQQNVLPICTKPRTLIKGVLSSE